MTPAEAEASIPEADGRRLTAVSLPQAVEDPQQGGLARAGVAHHQQVVPLADGQTQILHQQLLRVGRLVGEVLQDEGGVHRAGVDVKVTARVERLDKNTGGKTLLDSAGQLVCLFVSSNSCLLINLSTTITTQNLTR